VAFVEGCNIPCLGGLTVVQPFNGAALAYCKVADFRKRLYDLMQAVISREGTGLATKITFAIDIEYQRNSGVHRLLRVVIEGSSVAASLRNGTQVLRSNDARDFFTGEHLRVCGGMLEEWQQLYEVGV
jgi:hypothetical protein